MLNDRCAISRRNIGCQPKAAAHSFQQLLRNIRSPCAERSTNERADGNRRSTYRDAVL
jgi:hypothetical protein